MRARGGAAREASGRERRRPATPPLPTRDSATSAIHRPRVSSSWTIVAAAVRPASGSATASAMNTGESVEPADESPADRGVVAETDPMSVPVVTAVGGDRQPHLRARRDDRSRHRRPSARALADENPRSRRRPRRAGRRSCRRPCSVWRSRATDSLAAVQRLEERRRVPRSVRTRGALDVDHPCSEAGEDVGRQRARPQRREVGDDDAVQPAAGGVAVAVTTTGRGVDLFADDANRRDRGRPPSSTTSRHVRSGHRAAARPPGRSPPASMPSQAGIEARSSGRASDAAIHPSAHGTSGLAPPQLVMPDGPRPSSAARSASSPTPAAQEIAASPAP